MCSCKGTQSHPALKIHSLTTTLCLGTLRIRLISFSPFSLLLRCCNNPKTPRSSLILWTLIPIWLYYFAPFDPQFHSSSVSKTLLHMPYRNEQLIISTPSCTFNLSLNFFLHHFVLMETQFSHHLHPLTLLSLQPLMWRLFPHNNTHVIGTVGVGQGCPHFSLLLSEYLTFCSLKHPAVTFLSPNHISIDPLLSSFI